MKLPTNRDNNESILCTLAMSNCEPSSRRSLHSISGSLTATCACCMVDRSKSSVESDICVVDGELRGLLRICSKYRFGMRGHSSLGKPDTQRFKTNTNKHNNDASVRIECMEYYELLLLNWQKITKRKTELELCPI